MHTQPATACCAIHAVQPGRKSSVQCTWALVSTVQFVIVVNISHACRWKTIILHTCLSPFSSDTEHACCARQLCGALLYTTTTLPAFLRCVRVAWLTSLCIRWRCLPTLLLSPFLQGMTVLSLRHLAHARQWNRGSIPRLPAPPTRHTPPRVNVALLNFTRLLRVSRHLELRYCFLYLVRNNKLFFRGRTVGLPVSYTHLTLPTKA